MKKLMLATAALALTAGIAAAAPIRIGSDAGGEGCGGVERRRGEGFG